MGVTVRACAAGGGMPTVSDSSPSGVSCNGGTHDGQPIDLIIHPKGPLNPQEIQSALDEEMKKLPDELRKPEKKA
jgi:hypothetical protein